MKCPVCRAAELKHDTRDMSYAYKGETMTLPQVTACDESLLDLQETARTMQLMRDFRRVAGFSRLR